VREEESTKKGAVVVGRNPAQEVPAEEGRVEGSLVEGSPAEGSLMEEDLMGEGLVDVGLVDKIQAQLAEEERGVVGIWSGRECWSRRQLHLA